MVNRSCESEDKLFSLAPVGILLMYTYCQCEKWIIGIWPILLFCATLILAHRIIVRYSLPLHITNKPFSSFSSSSSRLTKLTDKAIYWGSMLPKNCKIFGPKMNLRMEFDSGVCPTFFLFIFMIPDTLKGTIKQGCFYAISFENYECPIKLLNIFFPFRKSWRII